MVSDATVLEVNFSLVRKIHVIVAAGKSKKVHVKIQPSFRARNF